MFVATCRGHSCDSDIWRLSESLESSRFPRPAGVWAMAVMVRSPFQSWLPRDGRGGSRALSAGTGVIRGVAFLLTSQRPPSPWRVSESLEWGLLPVAEAKASFTIANAPTENLPAAWLCLYLPASQPHPCSSLPLAAAQAWLLPALLGA